MTKDDFKKFAYCMTALGEAFSLEVSKMKNEIYFKALSDIPIDDFEKAIWTIINNRGTATFPKVAEIREAILGNVEDRANVALSQLEDVLGNHRGSGSVRFQDKTIHMAVTRMGGWIELSGLIDAGEWKYRRTEFIRLYKACVTSPCDYPEILEGTHRRDNLRQWSIAAMRELGWSETKIQNCIGYIDFGQAGKVLVEYQDEKMQIGTGG